MATVSINFKWIMFRPDNRQYRQQSTELVPDAIVSVDVPLSHEYIANSDDVIKGQLESITAIPKLTPEGMVYAMQQVEKFLLEQDKSTHDTESWGEDEFATRSKPSSSSDEWDEDDNSPSGEDEWDENGTDDEDKWSEEEEDWG